MILFTEKEIKLYNEVDINGQPAGDGEEPTDYTPEPVNAAGANEVPESAPNNADVPPEDGDAVDYTADDAGGNPPPAPDDAGIPPEGGDVGGGGDMDYTADEGGADAGYPPDDGGGNAGGAPTGVDNTITADEGRGMEEEIFKDLTQNQIDLKHKELKGNFLKLYEETSIIIKRVNEIPTSEEFVTTISFISNTLSDLRNMVADYMNNVYSTKSYMENAINYNKFLATLNGINDILTEISKELTETN